MTRSRKTTFRGGGGFLNDSDGKIVDVQATFDPPFANEGGYLYVTVSVQEDGKDAPTEQSLFAGGTEEEFTVSEDGHGVIPAEPGRNLSRGTAFADFIASIDATDHPGSQLDTDDVLNFSPLIGSRFRFVQQPLDAAELAKLKSRGKPTTRKDKAGKEWPLKKTVVSKFYGIEKGAAKTPAKAAPVAAKGRTVDEVRAQLAARRKTA